PHTYVLRSKGRPPRVLKTKETGIVIRPGDVIAVHSAGGGGWGAPRARSAAARARDRLLGFVSEAAKSAGKTKKRRAARRG
ncbi:MAG: hypothetical protein ACHQF3_09125, partial [Alphaproteobacteria bacterium]